MNKTVVEPSDKIGRYTAVLLTAITHRIGEALNSNHNPGTIAVGISNAFDKEW